MIIGLSLLMCCSCRWCCVVCFEVVMGCKKKSLVSWVFICGCCGECGVVLF